MSTGTGTPAAEPNQQQIDTIVIVRDYEPGQIFRIIIITPEQARQLPQLPPDALQVAIAPGGLATPAGESNVS
jgi:hypothetical protein